MKQATLQIENLSKSFVLHNQGEVNFQVLKEVSLEVYPGECVVLAGNSGLGKSTLLRCLYANYLSDSGAIIFNHDNQSHDLNTLSDRTLIQLRREKISYVSQFLRVIPRIPALEIVMQPMLDIGYERQYAERRASDLLAHLNIPERLWQVSPTTFSGGEQQRINIAREFTVISPLMLLDEPTASLDAVNRAAVIELIEEAKAQQSAIIGIFHDIESREQVADRTLDLQSGNFTRNDTKNHSQ
jgi:alpha-D-ribose 1-methylphosphonate 5-triphosphate synthase subunit PhnL